MEQNRLGGGAYRPGEVAVQRKREKGLKMVPPAFKGCLGGWHFTSYTEAKLTHVHKGSHSCVRCR